MSLNYRQQHQLRLIEAGLVRSDPQLAGMLGMFGRLSAGQDMPTWEQVPARRDRLRQAAALLVAAITIVTAAINLLLRAVPALLTAAAERCRARLPAPKRDRAAVTGCRPVGAQASGQDRHTGRNKQSRHQQ